MIVFAGIGFAVLVLVIILAMLLRRQLREKYATLWLIIGVALLILALFPGLLVGMARLLGVDSAQVQADRLASARRLADDCACVVVLKGSGSVIAAPGRIPCINASGDASLASAGTGDVLAGWLGGHWAQRDEADANERAWHAARRAVWWHGAAAEAAARPVLRAAELIEAMAQRR